MEAQNYLADLTSSELYGLDMAEGLKVNKASCKNKTSQCVEKTLSNASELEFHVADVRAKRFLAVFGGCLSGTETPGTTSHHVT